MNIVAQLLNPEALKKFGALPALRWYDGMYTYAQLNSNINFIGTKYREFGLGADDRIMLVCPDTPHFIAAYLAVLKIGAVAIAASTRSSIDDLKRMIHDSDAKMIICDPVYEEDCRRALAVTRNKLTIISLTDVIDGIENDTIFPEIGTLLRTVDDESLWVYSSGSTGSPKGVVHQHKNLLQGCRHFIDNLGLEAGDIVFCTSKLSFAYGLAHGLFLPLLVGACSFLLPDWATAGTVREVIERYQPKAVFSVPTMYRYMLEDNDESRQSALNIPEHYFSAGENLPKSIQVEWQKTTGRSLVNVYGCSETLFLVLGVANSNTPTGSVGSVMPNSKVALQREGEFLPAGITGEGILQIRHPFMFSHYAKRKSDTNQKLKNGWFDSGDLFHSDGRGNWYHMGRDDELIKVAGQWVNLRDIENACWNSELAVEVAVISVVDALGVVRPGLFFVPRNNLEDPLTSQRMKQYLDEQLERIKRPSWIRSIPEMPRTNNGKIHRSALQDMVAGQERDAI